MMSYRLQEKDDVIGTTHLWIMMQTQLVNLKYDVIQSSLLTCIMMS